MLSNLHDFTHGYTLLGYVMAICFVAWFLFHIFIFFKSAVIDPLCKFFKSKNDEEA